MWGGYGAAVLGVTWLCGRLRVQLGTGDFVGGEGTAEELMAVFMRVGHGEGL